MIALVMACLWLAMAGTGPAALTAKAMVLAGHPTHHHHGDGTVHFDDSADSRVHGSAAHADLPPAIPLNVVGCGAWARAGRPCGLTALPPAERALDGPFRPPRPSA